MRVVDEVRETSRDALLSHNDTLVLSCRRPSLWQLLEVALQRDEPRKEVIQPLL
ncbi:MAG: hypothetical protein ACRDF0_11885 [Candidatus Limnocylindria bacterium]